MMLWLLGACGVGDLFVQTSERCRCAVRAPLDLTRQPEDEEGDTVIYLEGSSPEHYVSISFYPRYDLRPVSLAADLVSDTLVPRGELAYIEMAGHRAAVRDYDHDYEGNALVHRRATVEVPHGRLFLHGWAGEDDWPRAEGNIQSVFDSLKFEPELPAWQWHGRPGSDAVREVTLLEARADAQLDTERWHSNLRAVPPPGSTFRTVRYPAPPGRLKGFLTADPGDGVRHPAVLWVETGMGGPVGVWKREPGEEDDGALDFVDAGFVVFAPAFRGELDNPGYIELYYGETQDLLAALAFLREQPHVDPDRIYLAGYGSGGTSVLLAAVAGAQARATLVFEGRASMKGVWEHYDDLPFDREDPVQARLRSAIHWAAYLEHPVYYFAPDRSTMVDAVVMAERAAEAGKTMTVHPVPVEGDAPYLAAVRALLIPKMRGDAPNNPPFTVTEEELWRAVQ